LDEEELETLPLITGIHSYTLPCTTNYVPKLHEILTRTMSCKKRRSEREGDSDAGSFSSFHVFAECSGRNSPFSVPQQFLPVAASTRWQLLNYF